MNTLEATELSIALAIRRLIGWLCLGLLILGAYWYDGDFRSHPVPIAEELHNEHS